MLNEVVSELPLSETQTCNELVRLESCPLERCIILVMYEYGGMAHDDLMMRKASTVHFVHDILGDGHS